MRFMFTTGSGRNIHLLQPGGRAFWYGTLALLLMAAPWLLTQDRLVQLTQLLTYALAGLGLVLLAGASGQFSLGHAAFMGIGAYTYAVLARAGVPFPVALAGAAVLSAVLGLLVGLLALRNKGIYLAIATLSFGFIVEAGLARWHLIGNTDAGISIPSPHIFGWTWESSQAFYYLCLFITAAAALGMRNLLRSPTGRAFAAIRDTEKSAQSMGIHLAYYRMLAFVISAVLAGIAGALYGQNLQHIVPAQFTVLQSINLLMMVAIGGLGSVQGAFCGALFLTALPPIVAQAKDYLPPAVGQAPGLQELVYGLVVIVFVVFEPAGLHGRWLKIRRHFA